uniref:Uncharacterized protein n=1 Tax=Arundo donax TaxID=35708 RepID=A0A0A9A109_ARUDO
MANALKIVLVSALALHFDHRIQPYAPAKVPALLSNFALGVHREGQDGPRSDGREEVPCNMASKVTHLAWHPTENFIVCSANNSLYMYHT